MEPIAFTPLYMERVWGGRKLAEAYGRALPDGVIGESWELVDRPEAQSVVQGGELDGATLQELWHTRREAVFGSRAARWGSRFPLLIKLLDARETLSVQVHPPAALADVLGGEPKTEMWVLVGVEPGAHLFAGLREGGSEAAFRAALEAGEDVSEMLHRIDVEVGDALFIPSGRVHAIGAGCLIVEIQQNSDTTYRVFDFNRPGLDGAPRELHVPQSLASIDFADVEPTLLPRGPGVLADNDCFRVTRRTLDGTPVVAAGECAAVSVLSGDATCGAASFGPGDCFLLPATDPPLTSGGADALVAELPSAR